MNSFRLFLVRLFLLTLIAGLQFSGFAQKGSVSGTIADSQTNDAIPFATIALYAATESAPVKGTVSDDQGNFLIEGLESQRYNLVVSFIGFFSDTIRGIEINNRTLDVNVGKINLSASLVSLEEVEVTAMAKTVRSNIDRKTYRTEDFETAKGGTAVDVLNKLPSVSVAPDGIVSVRGTSDFMVYLNGKPTLMDPSTLLAQLPADAITSIDVITIPTAKYDAQGKGGIININTRQKGIEGLSVSANGLIGGAPWGNFTTPYHGYHQNDNRYGGGLNILYNKNDLSLYGGLYYNERNINGSRTGDARLLQSDGSYYHMVAGGERPEWFIFRSL